MKISIRIEYLKYMISNLKVLSFTKKVCSLTKSYIFYKYVFLAIMFPSRTVAVRERNESS